MLAENVKINKKEGVNTVPEKHIVKAKGTPASVGGERIKPNNKVTLLGQVNSRQSSSSTRNVESIKMQRQAFGNCLSKEWQSWQENNPLSMGAAKALSNRRKLSQSASFNSSFSSGSAKSKRSGNNIREFKTNELENLSYETSADISHLIGSVKPFKKTQNIIPSTSTSKEPLKSSVPVKYINFNQKPDLKDVKLLCEKPVSVHFDKTALQHDNKAFEQDMTLDTFGNTTKSLKSKVRKVTNCNISDDDDDEEEVHCVKNVKLLSAKVFSENKSKNTFFDDPSQTTAMNKFSDFSAHKAENASGGSKKIIHSNQLKKLKTQSKYSTHAKIKIKNMKKLKAESLKTNMDVKVPSIVEYSYPEKNKFVSIFGAENEEPSVCCIPWIKEKMKRINKEKKKAKKQVLKLFPFDRTQFFNKPNTNNLLTLAHLSSLFDLNTSINLLF